VNTLKYIKTPWGWNEV